MIPKEKAKELYNKFNPHCLTKSFYGDDIERQSAQRCALIAVDEILNANLFDLEEKEYWQQVRTEIQNL
jgi:hypothetical protein